MFTSGDLVVLSLWWAVDNSLFKFPYELGLITHCKVSLGISDLNYDLLNRHLTTNSSCDCEERKEASEHCILHCPRFTHVRQNTIWTLHSTPPTFYTRTSKHHLNTAFYTAHVLHTYVKTPSEHCILHRPRFTHVRQNTIWTLHSTPPTFYTRTSKHHIQTTCKFTKHYYPPARGSKHIK